MKTLIMSVILGIALNGALAFADEGASEGTKPFVWIEQITLVSKFVVSNNSLKGEGSPLDLAGSTLEMLIRDGCKDIETDGYLKNCKIAINTWDLKWLLPFNHLGTNSYMVTATIPLNREDFKTARYIDRLWTDDNSPRCRVHKLSPILHRPSDDDESVLIERCNIRIDMRELKELLDLPLKHTK